MYVDRFDELKAAHVREIKKNETSTKLTSEDLRDAFINGIRPKLLREAVRQGKPQTLQDAKKRAKDQDDEDVFSEDEESSSESYKSHEKTKERKSKPKYSLKKEKITLQVPQNRKTTRILFKNRCKLLLNNSSHSLLSYLL
ncbi:hypothetical protein G6F62_014321 [Rhizopus arrhizus]|uniref:Uncharacterized protein n=1 Tax=Rhizopus oryzae TaxID=64495 RepID=A0A9P7BJE2_RHIOR|nr:hypothetical protein G6F23_014434 [Rhizopus arrhizus]KAG0745963.1 hypothetical protein G6F24_015795 [Rhizopus arrhizus]KAG0761011.1 hypothetical protein G6F22_018987 [Rhizopus arrhizus]KAG0774485.1 hypothetical protein G6F21_014152 [Rhizopus arrhizus]KAG0802907.1 hypothetical protein G6F20_014007 [Rhizopus arrhizus]